MDSSKITGGKDITVTICESLRGLEELRGHWNDLLAGASCGTVFLTWDWLYTWAERFLKEQRRLFLPIVSEGPNVIGIVPMYLDKVSRGPLRVRELAFLGIPETGSDYLDFITKKGKEQVVVESLLECLFGRYRKAWDILCLKEIPSGSAILTQLLYQLRRSGKHWVIEEGSYCPGVLLPGNFDEYFNRLSSHRRQQYKREMKILFSSERVEHVVCRKGQSFEEAYRTFRTLYEQRWGGDYGELFGFLQSYIERNGNADKAEVSLLMVDGRPVGGLLHLIHGEVMYMYLMAIDKDFNRSISIGNLMCGMNLKHAVESGFKEYDFLKGEEFYKLLWMNQAKRAINVSVYNKSMASLLAYITMSAKGLGKILLR